MLRSQSAQCPIYPHTPLHSSLPHPSTGVAKRMRPFAFRTHCAWQAPAEVQGAHYCQLTHVTASSPHVSVVYCDGGALHAVGRAFLGALCGTYVRIALHDAGYVVYEGSCCLRSCIMHAKVQEGHA